MGCIGTQGEVMLIAFVSWGVCWRYCRSLGLLQLCGQLDHTSHRVSHKATKYTRHPQSDTVRHATQRQNTHISIFTSPHPQGNKTHVTSCDVNHKSTKYTSYRWIQSVWWKQKHSLGRVLWSWEIHCSVLNILLCCLGAGRLNAGVGSHLCFLWVLELNDGILDVIVCFCVPSRCRVRGRCYCRHVIIHQIWVSLWKNRKLSKLSVCRS